MRVLVLSDSHGNGLNVRNAILREKSADVIIHLGDGADDVLLCPEAVGERRVILLKGNVDSEYFGAQRLISTRIGEAVIFACHGDKYGVRGDTQGFEAAARVEKADIALFGHTHMPYYRYDSGLHIVNPGAVKNGDYAVIEILDRGILCNHKHL